MMTIPNSIHYHLPAIRRVHINFDYEFVYLAVFFLFCISSVLSSSLFGFAVLLSKGVRMMCFGILAFLWMMRSYANTKRLWLHLLILLLFAVVMYTTGRTVMLVTALFIITAGGTKKEKIIWTSILGTLPTVLFVFLACYAGILPDRTYLHEGRLAHSAGFTYYSAYPYIIMFNMISYMFVQKRALNWIELAVAAAINYMLYQISTLRLSYYLTFGVIALYILAVKFRMFDLRKKWVAFLSLFVFPVTFAIAIYGALSYTPRRLFWRQANDLLSGRISLSHKAFERYAVKLFGQVIENNNMINGRIVTNNYFYVDSGYVYALLGYGVFVTLLLIVIYSYMLKRACEDNNKKMFIWLVTLAVFTIINNVWISISFNCLIMLLIPYLDERSDPVTELVKRWLHGEKKKS